MRAIDTNVLVRLVTRDRPEQAAAAERFIENGAWVSALVLAEATWVLSRVYNVSPKDLAKSIEMLLNHQNLVFQNPESVGDALDLFRAKPALGFSDCLILELARCARHLPLGTFDRTLGKADGTQALA